MTQVPDNIQSQIDSIGNSVSNIRSTIRAKGVTPAGGLNTYAAAIDMIAGGYRNIGEIITSTIPLTDAGLHLLDGALISGSGSYSAFIDYIADLYDSGDYSDIFETEVNWQSAVTANGVCGKFVYDSVNNTVRLPKYNSKIYTGGGTATVKGNGKSVGLTDGSTNYGINYLGTNVFRGLGAETYAYNTNVSTSSTQNNGYPNTTAVIGITTDGTKSGIIADLANITTSLDGYYYIVIATSTKTDIQVDIDEIATDLNGKVDTDLSNCTDVANIKMAHNAMPSNTYTDLTLGASGTTYTAPADGYVSICKVVGGDWYYLSVDLYDSNDVMIGSVFADCYRTSPATAFVPVYKGQKFIVNYNAYGATNWFRFIYAVGSESEAS